jgi:hypothetical protein
LHYADFQKWGINPRTGYFPIGVYFYFLSKRCESALSNGFATDRKYANIGRLNLDKFLVIKRGHPRHFGEDALNAAIDKIEAKYGKGSTENPDYHSSKLDMDGFREQAFHVLELFRVILGMEKRKTIRSFNECLHDAGYDGILDVNGAFLPIESCQGVQTWPGDAVEYVQSIRTPFRRERDGFEARTHNPYPEEMYKNALKRIRQYKPGTLKLTDGQFRTIVQNSPKEQRFDMGAELLARMDLSDASPDEVDYVSRFMIKAMDHNWDVLERNPTTPVWFWKYALSHGDEGTRATASDVLAAKTTSTNLAEILHPESTIEEVAVSFDSLSKSDVAMHLFKDETDDRGKVVVLYRPGLLADYMSNSEMMEGVIVGFIRVLPSDFSPKVWEVKGSAAEKGYGPIMYDIAMSLVSPNFLMADRSVVSPDARKVWKYMYDHRMAEYDVVDLPPFHRWSNLNPESPNHNLPHMYFAYRLKKKLPVYSTMYGKDSKFFAGYSDRDEKRRTLDVLEELAWTYFRDRTEPFGI